MMRISREQELDDATRAALASGRAHPALGLFIDTLMEMRGISEHEGEALAGAALEAEAPAAMSPHALDMVFAAIERGGSRPQRALAYPELSGLPVALRELVREAEGKRGWGVSGPGIRRLDLSHGDGLKLEIIRLEAGKAVPWHTHKGRELTLCVHGEYDDGLATYGPGDFSITDGTIRHQPKASEAGPGLCAGGDGCGPEVRGPAGRAAAAGGAVDLRTAGLVPGSRCAAASGCELWGSRRLCDALPGGGPAVQITPKAPLPFGATWRFAVIRLLCCRLGPMEGPGTRGGPAGLATPLLALSIVKRKSGFPRPRQVR